MKDQDKQREKEKEKEKEKETVYEKGHPTELNDNELLHKYQTVVSKYVTSIMGISADLIKDEKRGVETGGNFVEKADGSDKREIFSGGSINPKGVSDANKRIQKSMIDDNGEREKEKDKLKSSYVLNCGENDIDIDIDIDIDADMLYGVDDKDSKEVPRRCRTMGEDDGAAEVDSPSLSTSISASTSKIASSSSNILNINRSTNNRNINSGTTSASLPCPTSVSQTTVPKATVSQTAVSKATVSQTTVSQTKSSWSSQLKSAAFAPLNYLPSMPLLSSLTSTSSSSSPDEIAIQAAHKNVRSKIPRRCILYHI